MKKIISEKGLKRTIELIYDAVTEPEHWQEVVSALAHITGSNSGVLALENMDRSSMFSYIQVGFDNKVREFYTEHIMGKDVWLERLSQLPSNKFYPSHKILTQKAYLNSGMYNDWGAQQNIHHAVGAYLSTGSHSRLRLSFQRSNREGEYKREEVYRLNQLETHLKIAIKLHAEFSELKLLNQSTTNILDQMPFAALLLDQDRRVYYQNTRAESLLSSAKNLSVKNNRLCINSSTQHQWFSKMVLDCIAAGQGKGTHPSSTFQLNEHDGTTNLEVHVSPFIVDDCQFFLQNRKVLALVLIKDVVNAGSLNPQIIAELYSLTQQEAVLATLLCRGLKLEQIAEVTNITLNTVRTHIKRVFQKTDTNSQSQLVAKILTGVSPLSSSLKNL